MLGLAMDWSVKALARAALPQVSDERELRAFVLRIASIAILAALAVDAAQQLIFFSTWSDIARSWIITVIAAGGIAVPIAYILGRAQLELNQTKKALEQLSRLDPLTGMANRRWLLEGSETAAKTAMVLVLADIDQFKRVNDLRGHRVGDAVLRHVGLLMQNELGGLGMVGRFGGDEFALIAADPDLDGLIARLNGFRELLARSPLVVDGTGVHVSISAGVAVREPNETFSQLYADADAALYAAKAAGRNRIALSPAIGALAGVRSDLVTGRPLSVA